MVGSSIGGYAASDPSFKSFHTQNRISAFTIPVSMNAGPAANISIKYGFQGPLLNVDAACATAAHSIGYAFNMIRHGTLQIAVTGAADCPFSPAVVAAWAAMRALSSREDCPAQACRPFSADRDGLVLGEGAGILVLESESHALRRAVPILGEIKGYGASADSSHLTQPNQVGPVMAMRRALKNAGLTAEDINYINAHATGTQWNDKNETKAIKEVFGPRAYEVPAIGGVFPQGAFCFALFRRRALGPRDAHQEQGHRGEQEAREVEQEDAPDVHHAEQEAGQGGRRDGRPGDSPQEGGSDRRRRR